jgi:hypothetical protein
MAVQDWRPFLTKITVPEIEQQIVELKDRIRQDQTEIVFLTVLRRGLIRSKQLRQISQRKAEEAIDQAIRESSAGELEDMAPVHTNGEGGIRLPQ